MPVQYPRRSTPAQRRLGAVTALDEQAGGTGYIGRPHEQVQVAAGPQREVTIEMNGETRPLEGDHRKVVPGHQLEQRQ